MKRKSAGNMALLMAAVMTAAALSGTNVPAVKAAEEWIGADQLADNSTAEPEPDTVLPNKNQYNYQKEELAAFCHFGPNTFNEIEWGESYGSKKPGEIFRLTQDFDAETLVKAVKDAGFHKLIVTAKHHDGFCIWASDYTDYDVDATDYPGDAATGRKDILEEISAACTAENIDMGLYLSPWDIHDPSYGYYDEAGKPTTPDKDVLDYNEYYNNQLEEILSSPKYGNNGHFVEVWMDGAKGSGANAQEYDFKKWFDTIQKYEGVKAGYESDCMLFGANAYTTVRWIGNENGYADKNTWSKSKVDYDKNTINSNDIGGYTVGFEDGNQWTVPEADARITSGWFWGTTKAAPKSVEALGTMYFNSVGHNSPLLLNIPPNSQGTVDEAILNRLAEFGQNIKDTFDENMAAAEGASVKATNVRGNDTAFSPSNVVDGKDDTYWTTDDGQNSGSLLIDLGSSKKFDVVSIEEAIQNGQRINSYRVEYRSGGGEWTLLDEGETIGARRLIRTSAVTADQIRITVGTADGKVPMISEAGVYKASEGFELAASAPSGMDVIDIEDTDTSDGTGFAFNGKWSKESGSSYVNETNRWANAGAGLTLKFNGSKVYLVGTTDPGHGKATITIDGGDPVTVDTSGAQRATGQICFSSEDLDDGAHTLTLQVDTKAVGIEAAYAINNGGVGMIGLEADEFTMNEDETMNVKVTRVGGTNGRVKAYLSPNPGSAIQDDFNTEPVVVTLADGESETTVPVVTRRNKNKTGTQDFTIELNSPSSGLIIGFIDTAKVNILDAESMTKEQLQELADSTDGWSKSVYSGDWTAFENALADAKALLAQENPDALAMGKAYAALQNAKDNLKVRTQFTEEDPVVFPTKQGQTVRAEAELLELENGTAHDFVINKNERFSNGQSVSWFKADNAMYLYYNAPTTGTYTITVNGQSGRSASKPNRLIVSEANNNFAQVTKEFNGSNPGNPGWENLGSFDIEITTPGPGVMKIATDSSEGPNIDYLEIASKNIISLFDINAAATKGGSVDLSQNQVRQGEDVEVVITPDSGYEISRVLVGGADVTSDVKDGKYTISSLQNDAKVNVIFRFANYTEENRFNFPTKTGKENQASFEAEHMILQNAGDEPEWYIQVSEGDWASGGKYVNAMNAGDSTKLYYFAQKTGTYEATLQYRSGDPENSVTWSEAEGKIQSGELASVEGEENATTTHTAKLTFNVDKPGAGVLTFTAGEKNAPQLDKFDIVLTEETGEIADKIDLEIAMQEAERELAREDTYTEDSKAALQEALNAAEAVFADPDATQAEADEQLAAFKEALNGLKYLSYTITASVPDGGGTVKASADSVDRNGSVDLTITPDYGYTLTSLAVNGAEVSGFHKYNIDYPISNITEDKAITAAFEKTGYTESEPFTFPTAGGTATLEAEDFTLFNVNGNTEQWKLGITNGSASGWEGGAVYINSFEPGDYISVPYTAEAGTYDVAVRYSSGSAANKLVWSSDGKIKEGQASAGNGNASEFVTAKFEVTVTESGSGVWTFTSPADGKSPRIDRFEITSRDTSPEPAGKYSIAASVEGGHGTVSVETEEASAGGDAVVTFNPDEGYAVGTVTVNGTEVKAEGNSYTLSDIREDKKVAVTYVFDYYTEDEPFYFPATAGATETVQAEHFILRDNEDGKGEIRESEADWAEGGKFVNWFNAGDSIILNYYAEKAGEYKFTMRYQSGSASNGISWSGDRIESGSLDSVTADASGQLQPRTVDFTVNVTEAGAGQLTIAAGQANAPQVDQFVAELVEEKGAPAPVDKTKLDERIKNAEAEAAKTDTYTADSIEALNAAIEAAKEVSESEDATQKAVNEQAVLLRQAVADLVNLPETFAVTATAGAGGKIELTGDAQDGTVEKGRNAEYTVTADEGFVIDTLTVNGQEAADAAGQKSYNGTVSDVQAAVEITAVFKEETVQPDPEEPAKEDPSSPAAGGQDRPAQGGQNRPSSGSGTAQSDKEKASVVQTGDTTDIGGWAIALAAAAAAGMGAIVFRKRNTE